MLRVAVSHLPSDNHEHFFRLLLTANGQSTGPCKLSLCGDTVHLSFAEPVVAFASDHDVAGLFHEIVQVAEQYRKVFGDLAVARPVVFPEALGEKLGIRSAAFGECIAHPTLALAHRAAEKLQGLIFCDCASRLSGSERSSSGDRRIKSTKRGLRRGQKGSEMGGKRGHGPSVGSDSGFLAVAHPGCGKPMLGRSRFAAVVLTDTPSLLAQGVLDGVSLGFHPKPDQGAIRPWTRTS